MKIPGILLIGGALLTPTWIWAGEPAQAHHAEAKSQVRAAMTAMGEALSAADCEQVAGFFAKEFSFYARGREIGGHDQVLATCRQIPRPFPQMHYLVNEVRPLSDSTVYTLRVMDIERSEAADFPPAREVITQLWKNTDGQWRIIHMHVSIDGRGE